MKILEKIKSFKSEFVRNVILVMTGTAISQVIAISVTPILTRNYTPEDFGFLLIYLSTLTIVGTFSTGKFEKAILLMKSERDIKKVVFLSLFISFFISFVLSLILFFGKSLILENFSFNESLYDWWYTLPFLLIIYSEYSVFNTILNYQKRFKKLSMVKVVKTISSVIISISCIFFIKDARGLILGEFLGYLIAFSYLLYLNSNFFRFDKKIIGESKIIAKRYKNFPIYSIPSDFMNMASFQMPAFFLTTYFGVGVTGFYSLMKRVLDAPVGLFSSSILEVFRQKASEQYLEKGNCKNLFVKTAKSLAILSIIPFIILFLFAPKLFAFVFGENWLIAGQYARILCIYYYFKFISSPLSYMFYIAEKQSINFLLQFYLFLTTILVFNLPRYIEITEFNLLWIYAVNLVFFYVVMFLFSFHFSKNHK
ncbi:lipopolysaccharide biosynthesis protein [Flavivirga sp. 57AJ16]|uniref:lipopolysaccharide biosynthesis protein n=1 Tax=Flavivirga sp. 57AJ16 TaxID=3025307 RepID=UPI0023660761|nr:oligosaccharide flippase family protein [Flavivirga sp. 57AJ16]MDD7885925.1 oligosaccharide flippase family protein [Flavivirga sp. 57AJ16]